MQSPLNLKTYTHLFMFALIGINAFAMNPPQAGSNSASSSSSSSSSSTSRRTDLVRLPPPAGLAPQPLPSLALPVIQIPPSLQNPKLPWDTDPSSLDEQEENSETDDASLPPTQHEEIKVNQSASSSSSSSSSSRHSSSVLYPHNEDPDRIKIRDLLIPPHLLTSPKTRWVDPLFGIAQGALRISREVVDGALSVFQRVGLVAPLPPSPPLTLSPLTEFLLPQAVHTLISSYLNREELQKLQEEHNDETVNMAIQLAMANMQTLLIVPPQHGGKEEENTGENAKQANTLFVEELRQHIWAELKRHAQMGGIHIRSIRIVIGSFYRNKIPILVTRDLMDYMKSEFPSLEYVEVDENRFLIKELEDLQSVVHHSPGFSPCGFDLKPQDLTPDHATKLIDETREPILKDLVLINQRRLRLIELSLLHIESFTPTVEYSFFQKHNFESDIIHVINDLTNPANVVDNWTRIRGFILSEMFKRRKFWAAESRWWIDYGGVPHADQWREGSRRNNLEWILAEDGKASTSQCIEARLLLDSGDSNYEEIASLPPEKVESILKHIKIILDPESPAYYFQRGVALETLARLHRYHPRIVRPFFGALKMAQYLKDYIMRAEKFIAELPNKDDILTIKEAFQYLEELKKSGDYAEEVNSWLSDYNSFRSLQKRWNLSETY